MMDLVPIWYHDRYWSRVFISTISTHDHEFEVKVTDIEFLECMVNVLKNLDKTFLFHK